MREWITVGKESKAVQEQIAAMIPRVDKQKRAYESMGALKENMRIMAILAQYLEDNETDAAEARALLVFQLMQALRLPE